MHPEQKTSDTNSELSDGGTGASGQGSSCGGSNENLRELAAELGITPEELYEERFRVDRRKLEHMILGDDDSLQPADMFFRTIMNETRTSVMWPSRLKIGAKSKKDPHVRVAGRREDVKAAKEKVMAVLDTRSNRVTMKLDVSYTDHSHIIGKLGTTIKKVMLETGCHIHFPDSNRSNVNEKSNQVSIAGELEGVEQARARVRKLSPLIFSFELPIVGTIQPLPDNSTPVLKSIQEKYNVHIMFKSRPKLYGTLVMIKGCEWEVARVKEATLLVIHHMCESLGQTHVPVQMTMEISPQHHGIVLGKNSNNLKMIMQRTGTQIMFPDASDPNIPTIKKSNVCITGSINNVYIARQQLMGSLPVVLMFDLPDEMELETEMISHTMQSLDVVITIRHKVKQNVINVVIKGIERHASNVYEARNRILGLEGPRVIAEIPATYNIPSSPSQHPVNNDIYGSGRSLPRLTINTNCVGLPALNIPPMRGGLTPPMPGGISPPFPSPVGNIANPWNNGFPSPVPAPMPMLHPSSLNHILNLQHQQMGSPLLPAGSCASNSSGYSTAHTPRNYPNSFSMSDTKDGNVFSSLSSNTSSLSSPAVSPQSGNSPIQKQADSTNSLCNMMQDLISCPDRRAPGYEVKKSREIAKGPFGLDAEERKKLFAYNAIQHKPVAGDLRVPTSSWSGYGLSQSSPAPELEQRKKESFEASLLDEASGTDCSPCSSLMYPGATDFDDGNALAASNYLDSTPSSIVNRITGMKAKDLVTLLISLGLEKYIRHFTSHEIDLATFATLNEGDLREIGVSAVGARRKMLLTISELNKRQSQFCGSAAPGAERKMSASQW